MGIAELSESEQVVLFSLVGLVARADGQVSESEMDTLERLRGSLSADVFERVRDRAAALDSADAILDAARGVTRPGAREAIYGVLIEMALPDTIAANEGALLERLADLWELDSPTSAS